jgi:UDP-N-acetylmuramoyl-tripeptide--D-alanyl-D-alanine ligase
VRWSVAAAAPGSEVEILALTAGAIAAASGGEVVRGEASTPVGRVSIDSRTLAPGDLFVAIRGERFDGHRFAASALDRGALGVVVDAAGAGAIEGGRPDAVVVRVADTTRALQLVARDVRRRSGAKVVAITGSAGKTTTKEITAEFLAAQHRVFRNKGNLNNHIGLPLSLLELRARPDVAVVELGMNHPGEIRTLVEIAEPEFRVWTNVGDAHLGFFASADAIADAKAEILEHASGDSVLVANAADARVMARVGKFTGRVVTFGMNTTADVGAVDVELRGLEGTRARVRTKQGEMDLTTPLLGLGNLSNVLAATATALEFGISLESIRERAATLTPAAHRGELLRLPGGITLIDDSYNSSPSALNRALELVGSAQGCARKVAVLGEMLELGAHAGRLHTECGRAAADAGVDILITVGGTAARALADAAVAAGMTAANVLHVATKQEAADVVAARVRPGDLVLVKGSRGIGTDLVVERLKAEFA